MAAALALALVNHDHDEDSDGLALATLEQDLAEPQESLIAHTRSG
jgi:hypothetical protein